MDVSALSPAARRQVRAKYRAAAGDASSLTFVDGQGVVRGRSKYGAQATVVDGIRFASKLEMRLYRRLCALVSAGVIRGFLRQAPLHLPGGVRMVIDFAVDAPGGLRLLDAKGAVTETWRTKQRIAEALHPWRIETISRHTVDTWCPEGPTT